ncbi:MAG: DUF4129 domain-containing protein [Methanomassiliicoccales archaeon]|nr:DUF4129 domain-containing protein [Methanomassiliicoccales archaeon]
MLGGGAGRRIWLATAVTAMTIIALALIVANSSSFDLGDGGTGIGPAASAISEVLVYFLVIVVIVLIVLIIFSSSHRMGRIKPDEPAPGGSTSYFVMLVIVVALAVLVGSTYGQVFESQMNDEGGSGDDEGNGGSVPPLEPKNALTSLAILGMILAVLLMSLFAVFRYARNKPLLPPSPMVSEDLPQAQVIVEDAMDDLYKGEDARSVIVRAYQRMTRLVQSRMEVPASLTPRELADRAGKSFGWPEGPTMELTSLFEEAWYSDHRLEASARERALSCLREISTAQKEFEIRRADEAAIGAG